MKISKSAIAGDIYQFDLLGTNQTDWEQAKLNVDKRDLLRTRETYCG